MSCHSLTFLAAKRIHDHHTYPSKDKFIQVYHQQLENRIIGLSISILAVCDVVYHVSLSAFKFSTAFYKAIVHKKEFSLNEAYRHLKIAALFRSAVISGSVIYFVKPALIFEMFDNDITRFVRALLLSDLPELFEIPEKMGITTNQHVLALFCRFFKELAQETQKSMNETFALVKDAHEFQEKLIDYDYLFKNRTYNDVYISINNLFNSFKPLKKDSLFEGVIKRIAAAGLSVSLGVLSLSLAGATCPLIAIQFSEIIVECIQSLVSNQNNDLRLHLKIIALNAFSLFRCLIAFPCCLSLGVVIPFKVNAVLFSPLYEGDKEVKKRVITELVEKIQKLVKNASVLIPLRTLVDYPSNIEVGHSYYLLVTKLSKNYRLSIINRGVFSDSHPKRSKSKRDVDCSWDYVNFNFLKDYISLSFKLQDQKALEEFFKEEGRDVGERFWQISSSLNKLKLYFNRRQLFDKMLSNLFAAHIYGLPWGLVTTKLKGVNPKINQEATYFESHHERSSQKIGNCGVSSLLGAVSFHSSMLRGDFKNKSVYYRFSSVFRKMLLNQYDYLLDLDFSVKEGYVASEVVRQKLKSIGV